MSGGDALLAFARDVDWANRLHCHHSLTYRSERADTGMGPSESGRLEVAVEEVAVQARRRLTLTHVRIDRHGVAGR